MSNLKSITFPISAELGAGVLRNCPFLEEVHLTGIANSIAEDEIYDLPEDTVFFINKKAKKLGQHLRGEGYEVIEE